MAMYEYDLDPAHFLIVKDFVKTLVCNNCSLEQQYYVYSKKKDVYCSCLNHLYTSGGSKVKLINSTDKLDNTNTKVNTEPENISNFLLPDISKLDNTIQ